MGPFIPSPRGPIQILPIVSIVFIAKASNSFESYDSLVFILTHFFRLSLTCNLAISVDLVICRWLVVVTRVGRAEAG